MFNNEELDIIKNKVIPAALMTYTGYKYLQYRKDMEPILFKFFENKGLSSYKSFKKEYIESFFNIDGNLNYIDFFFTEIYKLTPHGDFSYERFFSTKEEKQYIYNATVKETFNNPLYKKDSVELKKRHDKLMKYCGKYLSEEDILFTVKKGLAKKGWIKDFASYISKETAFKLLKESRVIPSYFIRTHKFTENELIEIIKNHKDFTSKAAVMGGSQDKRTNAANHILKWQTVSAKVLKTILEIGFSGDEEPFLRSMANRKITMQNVEQTDEFINQLIDAGAKFTYIDTTKASDATKLLIEVSK